MSGIYIHIPFCKQKCNYCNFYSVASTKYRDVFTEALLTEMKLRQNYLPDKNINTVYFGGGTPSLLKIDEINQILDNIENLFYLSENAEITLEANPDDLTPEYLKNLKNHTKINRLSIGVQSFSDDDLNYLQRIHNSATAHLAIENAIKTGFENITIDLIYGIPTLSEKNWKKNLEIFFSYHLPHLSSYALTVEPNTALKVLIDKKRKNNVSEDASVKHFEILLEETKTHNFTSSEKVDTIIKEKEILSEIDLFNEYVMTSLRTVWGCDANHIENVFGKEKREYFEKSINRFIKENKIKKTGTVYSLTNKGKLFADGIASDMFL